MEILFVIFSLCLGFVALIAVGLIPLYRLLYRRFFMQYWPLCLGLLMLNITVLHHLFSSSCDVNTLVLLLAPLLQANFFVSLVVGLALVASEKNHPWATFYILASVLTFVGLPALFFLDVVLFTGIAWGCM